MDKVVNQYGTLKDREEKFKKAFNELYKGKYEYHSDYAGLDKKCKIKCLACGGIIERNTECLRHSKNIECKYCIDIERKNKRELMTRIRAINRLNAKLKCVVRKSEKESSMETYNHVCNQCGKHHVSTRKNAKYCSSECMIRFNNSTKKHTKRKRVKANGSYEDTPLDRLITRDNNICHICDEACDSDDYRVDHKGSFIAGKSYPSVDHIIPVCKGGTNTWDNVKLAHFQCNSNKGGSSMLIMKKNVIRFDI